MLHMQARHGGRGYKDGKKPEKLGGGERMDANMPLTQPLHVKDKEQAESSSSHESSPRDWVLSSAQSSAQGTPREQEEGAGGGEGATKAEKGKKKEMRSRFSIAETAFGMKKEGEGEDPPVSPQFMVQGPDGEQPRENQVAPEPAAGGGGDGAGKAYMVKEASNEKLLPARKKESSWVSFKKGFEKKRSRWRGYPGQVSKYMVDPRWKIMRRWDIVTLLLLVFTALVTPYEVAFLELDILHPLTLLNRLVDFCFVVDLVLNFNLMRYDDDKNVYITSRSEVARRYLQGFFIIDVVSIFPFDEVGEAFSPSSGPGGVAHLRVLRVLRILRLAKLLRILRSGRIFQRWESSISIKYGVVQLIKFMIATALIAHWMACAWHLVRVIEDIECNWAQFYFEGCHALSEEMDTSAFTRYIAALYLSVMTISTVGYGDVAPQTDAERAYLVCAMLLGASVFAYVVGSICGIVASMDQKETEFYDLMDSLNTFIKDARLAPELGVRLRSFFRYRRYCTQMNEWHHLLNIMSPALRGEVAMQLNSDWISQVRFFRDCPQEMLIQLSFVLTSETFPPFEEVIAAGTPAAKMYIIKKGLIVCRGRVLGAGKVAGEDMLFKNGDREYSARTLIYSELYSIKREDFGPILHHFPEVARSLRRVVVKYVFREHILAYTRAVRMVEEQLQEQRDAAAKGGEPTRDSAGKVSRAPIIRHNTFLTTLSGLSASEGPSLELSYAHQLSVLMRVDEEEATKLEEAAVRMQRHFRGHRDRKKMVELKKSKREGGGKHQVEHETLARVKAMEEAVKRVEARLGASGGAGPATPPPPHPAEGGEASAAAAAGAAKLDQILSALGGITSRLASLEQQQQQQQQQREEGGAGSSRGAGSRGGGGGGAPSPGGTSRNRARPASVDAVGLFGGDLGGGGAPPLESPDP